MSDMHNHMDGSKLDVNLALAIGELKGQMAALSEMVNRKVKSNDDLSAAVAKLSNLPDDIKAIKTSMADMDERLRVMEQSDTDRNARQDMIAMILKSPALGWLVGAVTVIGGVASGHLQVGLQ
jgi:chromosome segregation ATPase